MQIGTRPAGWWRGMLWATTSAGRGVDRDAPVWCVSEHSGRMVGSGRWRRPASGWMRTPGGVAAEALPPASDGQAPSWICHIRGKASVPSVLVRRPVGVCGCQAAACCR